VKNIFKKAEIMDNMIQESIKNKALNLMSFMIKLNLLNVFLLK